MITQIDNRVSGIEVAAMMSLGEVIQAAVDHLHGEGGEGAMEVLGDGISEIDQGGIHAFGGQVAQSCRRMALSSAHQK